MTSWRTVARPSSVRTMTEVERAWVGAFVEADGSAFIVRRSGCSPSPRVYASQREVDPIATLLRVTGVGSIQWWKEKPSVRFQSFGRGSRTYEIWRWTVGRRNDALDILRQCAPYSWKFQTVLEEWGSV